MTIRAVHELDRHVSVRVGEVEIAKYVYRLDPEPFEAPKPYVHPMRTLADDVVTCYRPHDHRWHKGLQLTATELSGHNLWGGHTFVRGRGYTKLDNVGSMRPEGPVAVDADREDVTLHHDLVWMSAGGDRLAGEYRELRFVVSSTADSVWTLEWRSAIRNDTPDPLSFGSPATRGLPGSGYAGLWWRGPRSFTGGTVLTPSGTVDPAEFRGRPSPWLAFVGDHDEVDRQSTVVFVPAPDDDVHWFVRSTEFAAVNPSWAFHHTFDLLPGELFTRRYRVGVATGAWTEDDVTTWLKEHPW